MLFVAADIFHIFEGPSSVSRTVCYTIGYNGQCNFGCKVRRNGGRFSLLALGIIGLHPNPQLRIGRGKGKG